MKTFKKNTLAVCSALMICLTFGSAVSANVCNVDFKDCKEAEPWESELFGSWEYSADNAPEQYKLGAISIFYENGENNVFVQLDEKEIFGKKVSLVGNTISFEVKLEGTLFQVKLTAKGEVLSGTYTSVNGTFKIKGARVKIM